MAAQKTIPEILSIAKVSQYLAANDININIYLKGGSLDSRLDRTIYMERRPIQEIYDLNPSDPSLRNAANYLYAMLGKYALLAENVLDSIVYPKPVVTGPNDQTINISGTATFTIGIVSQTDYVIAWYKNGVLVPGANSATYAYPATIADNGDQVMAIVTNAAGSTSSVTATLTVTNSLTVYLHFGDTDEYPNISAGIDALDYQITNTTTLGSSIFDFPLTEEAANNKWLVIKYPKVLGHAVEFYSTDLNKGLVPGPEFYDYKEIGDFYYTCSRNDLSFEVTPFNPLMIKVS